MHTAKYGKLQFWSEFKRAQREREKSLICGGSNNRESDDTNGYNPLQKIAVYESDESDEIDVGMVKMQLKNHTVPSLIFCPKIQLIQKEILN